MKKVVTFGEVMLRLATPGYARFSECNDYSVAYGGSELNVAVSLTNFGIPTEFITRLPDNPIAHACIDELRKRKLCTDGIVFGGDRMGIYFLENGAAFRNSRVVYDRVHSAFATLQPGMIDWENIFRNACWFHWSGIDAALSESGAEACLEALQVADRMGLTISCDLNFRKNLWKYGKKAVDVMQPLVQYSDVIFGSEPEYREFMGIQPVGFKATKTNEKLDIEGFTAVGKRVKELVPRCKKMFIELRNTISTNHHTLAAVLYSDDTLKCSRIYDVDPVVDCVGTGDAFVGGLIYGLLTYQGDDQKTVDFAIAASALKNTFPGDFNLATLSEVESLMGSLDSFERLQR